MDEELQYHILKWTALIARHALKTRAARTMIAATNDATIILGFNEQSPQVPEMVPLVRSPRTSAELCTARTAFLTSCLRALTASCPSPSF